MAKRAEKQRRPALLQQVREENRRREATMHRANSALSDRYQLQLLHRF